MRKLGLAIFFFITLAQSEAWAAPEWRYQQEIRSVEVGPLAQNSNFQAPEALPGVREEGGPIDVSAWKYRKKVLLEQAGIQRLELDLEVLAHHAGYGADLRLVRDGRQVPFILDSTGPAKSVTPQVARLDAKMLGQSRWVLTLPFPSLPVTAIGGTPGTPLFQRTARVVEEAPDPRGDTVRRVLGEIYWRRMPSEEPEPLTLPIHTPPQTHRLILEVDDGDNSPLPLSNFLVYYNGLRLLFKASPGADLYLYYGKPDVSRPSYDLNLIAGELLAAHPSDASLAAEEALQAKAWWEAPMPSGATKYVFWGVMGLVVLALLGVIAKLLPSEKK